MSILDGRSYEIKKYGFEVIFNGITCLPNFVKIHLSVQKLLVGGGHRQADDFISLFYFLESRLITHFLAALARYKN
jgi:hypothetical protein